MWEASQVLLDCCSSWYGHLRLILVGGNIAHRNVQMGLTWGGYNYPWKSTHVLVPLLLGSALLAFFVVWEVRFAKYPMFPHRLGKEPRVLALTLVITAIRYADADLTWSLHL